MYQSPKIFLFQTTCETIFLRKNQIKIMSLINILNIVRSLDQEPDQLSEEEEANLFIYLTGNDTILVEVENLCNLWQTNSAKLKYLRGLSKKSAPSMFL